MKSKDSKKREKENLIAGLSASEIVDRYGSANAEHIVGHTGINNETQQKLQKGLKDISKYKVNADYEKSNLQQQAGFSAEIKKTSRANAENIINKSDDRISRTDDITINGKKAVNHEKFDHANVDKNGNPIFDNNGELVGGSQQKVHFDGDKIEGYKKYDKYSKPESYDKYKEAIFDVPSDQYEDIQQRYTERIKNLEGQEKRLRAEGKSDLADQKKSEIERRKDLKNRFRDSGISTEEAMEARKDPFLSTVKDMGKVSHRAGIEAAKGAMVIAGSISLVQNFIAVTQNKKDLKEAIGDTANTTAKSVGVAYTSGFAGSLIKSGMQQAKSSHIRALSKTSLPALVVTTCLETGKCVKRYISGEIDEVELFEELGETGTGMLASSLGATIGQIVIPVPIVGSIIGGMVGYTLNSIFYSEALNALKGAKLAEENYYRVKSICEAARLQIHEYKAQMCELFEVQFKESVIFYKDTFEKLNISINNGDITLFEKTIITFSDRLGKELHYKTFSEFDDAMKSDESIKI
ncbi:MAG: hypothetical protein B6229_03750 [Spirochaetaceae bacterium 4572_7]|nr:MAG: hypothetical protein B6229_03750 [Spirochaetaceae bacterium 4572_7]